MVFLDTYQMLEQLREDLHRQGYAFCHALWPEKETTEVAQLLGTLEEIPNVPSMQTLVPREITSSKPNAYSGNFGLDEFPLHTHLAYWYLPPRYVVLRSKSGFGEVFTGLMAYEEALQGIGPDQWQRARFKPRRPWNGRLQLLGLIQRTPRGVIFRWDSLFLVPDNDEARQVFSAYRGPCLGRCSS